MSLAKKHAAEKEKLKKLLENLDEQAKDWKSFSESVGNYIGFGYGDPTQHFKDALMSYLDDV